MKSLFLLVVGLSSSLAWAENVEAPKAWLAHQFQYEQAENYYQEDIRELDPQNATKAINLYLKSAEAGYQPAQIRLGLIYINEISGNPEGINIKEAQKWLQRAADNGSGEAAYWLGYLYGVVMPMYAGDDPENRKKAFEYYLKSIALGYNMALFIVAEAYERGDDLPQDLNLAFKYYKRAADAGDYSSFAKVGRMYQKGIGTQKDLAKAYEYYTKPDEVFANNEEYEPDSDIIYYLGQMYRDGEYVKQDKQLALDYFKMVCEGMYDTEKQQAPPCQEYEALRKALAK